MNGCKGIGRRAIKIASTDNPSVSKGSALLDSVPTQAAAGGEYIQIGSADLLIN